MSLKRSVLIGFASLTLLCGLATQADAVFLFYMRKDLSLLIRKTPKKIVGKDVTVTDELAVIWPETIKLTGDKRKNRLNGQEYVLFDTTYFSCAIPKDRMGTHLTSIWNDAQKGYKDVTKQIEDVNERQRKRELNKEQATKERQKLYWELYRVWSNKPIVTVFGKVQRADFWGPVFAQARGAGVATEKITLVLSKVEKPRKRWYRSLDEY